MAAVVESIADVGYPRTTAAEISRRAGLTWGAVQHHFGDKDGILMAVLEENFERFAQQLGDAPAAEASLEERVAAFVQRSWAHFASPEYRSTFEILLHLPTDLEIAWQQQMFADWSRVWSRYFPESEPARQPTAALMHYTISVLSGLATTGMLEGAGPRVRARELGYLQATLGRELARAPSRRSGPSHS
jgi:AcrR family transcriptional regulator